MVITRLRKKLEHIFFLTTDSHRLDQCSVELHSLAYVVPSRKVKTERIDKYACRLKLAYCKQISSTENEIKLIQILC